jgi:glutamate dehydrogenase (NAD(P)+)
VVRFAEIHGVNNRIAAYMLAIDRVAYTIRQRGIYAWDFGSGAESRSSKNL